MDRHHARGARRAALAAALLMGFAASAHAETGTAHGADMSVHIDLLGVVQLDVDPQVPVGFQDATDPTDQQDSLPSFDTGGALLHLSTGTLATQAQYAPGASFSAAGANVELQNVDLSAVSALSQPLISLTADAIRSKSLVTGYCLPTRQQRSAVDDIMFFSSFDQGNLFTGGDGGPPTGDDTSLNGVQLSILGIAVPGIPEAPAPNTAIDLGSLGIAGATLILNEHTVGGDGVNTASLSTNAMHMTLDVAGLVTAEVVFAHSDSKLDCTQ